MVDPDLSWYMTMVASYLVTAESELPYLSSYYRKALEEIEDGRRR